MIHTASWELSEQLESNLRDERRESCSYYAMDSRVTPRDIYVMWIPLHLILIAQVVEITWLAICPYLA